MFSRLWRILFTYDLALIVSPFWVIFYSQVVQIASRNIIQYDNTRRGSKSALQVNAKKATVTESILMLYVFLKIHWFCFINPPLKHIWKCYTPWYFCCRDSEGLLKCFSTVNFPRFRFMLEDVRTGSIIKPLTHVTFPFSFLFFFPTLFPSGFWNVLFERLLTSEGISSLKLILLMVVMEVFKERMSIYNKSKNILQCQVMLSFVFQCRIC